MSPVSGSCGRLAVIGLAAAALVLLSACGSVHGQPASGGSAPASPGSSGPGAARQAVLAAAIHAPRITSAVTTLQVRRTWDGGGKAWTGTIRYRMKPTLAISEDLRYRSGPITATKTIITRKRMYSDADGPAAGGGEIWMDLSPRTFQFQLQDLQEDNFTGMAQLFAAARNAHVVGTRTIGGVPTTEYAGSFRASDALRALPASALPASLRKVLGTRLPGMEGTVVSFREWLDDQHNVRRAVEVETAAFVTVTTINVTAINQPLRITLPPEPQFPPASAGT